MINQIKVQKAIKTKTVKVSKINDKQLKVLLNLGFKVIIR